MMVFIGGIVGTILIAMYLPIFSVAGNVKSQRRPTCHPMSACYGTANTGDTERPEWLMFFAILVTLFLGSTVVFRLADLTF